MKNYNLLLTNKNYCATVVQLEQFRDLSNCDNVKAAIIFDNQVIVDKQTNEGDIGLFFPVECCLSHEFLSKNNLYRKSEWGNIDPTKTGFFEKHGRVKCVKFRGHSSEGIWLPLTSLSYLGVTDLPLGAEFNAVFGHDICEKYVPLGNPKAQTSQTDRNRKGRAEDKIVPGQFRYHIDTDKLERNLNELQLDSIISITEKYHGASAIFGRLLVNPPWKWYQKILRWFGIDCKRYSYYDYVWASRRVIKGVGDVAREGVRHYYKSDIWKVIFDEIKKCIPDGYTIYGEIVGYTPDGSPIQPGYDYCCLTGEHRFLVYRITYTNPDGKVFELSWPEIKNFCYSSDPPLESVHQFEYATVQELMDKWGTSEKCRVDGATKLSDYWRNCFLADLKHIYVNNGRAITSFNLRTAPPPAEGVVVRIENRGKFKAFKCKSTAFLEWETKQLDSDFVDMETLGE